MPTVSIEGQERTYNVENGSNLIESLNKQGADLPAGCLAGSCGACRILITKSPESLSNPDQMEKNTIESLIVNYRRIYGPKHLEGADVRLSCRANVIADVTIEILD